MALQKTITLPYGVSGNYIRLTSHRWDRATREASAIFALYLDADAAAAGAPPFPGIVAKLRLTGDDFNLWLSPAAMVAADGDILAQLYAAAKVHAVISDHGAGIFSGAEDV